MTKDDTKIDFIRLLKGKKDGGELSNWAIRDVIGKDDSLLGQLAYGWNWHGQTWRTSAVIKIHDTNGPHKILETRNTFYTLVGDEATEEEKQILYNVNYF